MPNQSLTILLFLGECLDTHLAMCLYTTRIKCINLAKYVGVSEHYINDLYHLFHIKCIICPHYPYIYSPYK